MQSLKTIYEQIERFSASSQQQAEVKQSLLLALHTQKEAAFFREAKAHFVSSAFIVNRERSKVLMVHHNLRNTWSWPGGHADGCFNLEAVARKEAFEETGISRLTLLQEGPAALDIFEVAEHSKRGQRVEAHRHLALAYLYEADESDALRICLEENSAAAWLPAEQIGPPLFNAIDTAIYQKLINLSKSLRKD